MSRWFTIKITMVILFLSTFFYSCTTSRWDSAPEQDATEDKDRYLLPIAWEIEEEPVIAPGQLFGIYDIRRVSCCSVLQMGDRLRMYYWAEDEVGHYRIVGAECTFETLNEWKPLGVLLERQPDKPHNSQGPCYAQVVPRENGPWLMYICTWGTARPDGKLPYGTALALSDDEGLTWYYPNDDYILPHTQVWNSEGTGSVCAVQEPDKWRMYYSSFGPYGTCPEGAVCFHGHTIPSVSIGYAESRDGVEWYYPMDKPAASPRKFEHTPYEYLLSKPWVIHDGAGYRMWCGAMGERYRIRSLTSPDAVNWTFQDDWVFRNANHDDSDGIGKPGSFDSIQRSYPCVIRQGDVYHMWYTGNWFGRVENNTPTGIGYARGTLVRE